MDNEQEFLRELTALTLKRRILLIAEPDSYNGASLRLEPLDARKVTAQTRYEADFADGVDLVGLRELPAAPVPIYPSEEEKLSRALTGWSWDGRNWRDTDGSL